MEFLLLSALTLVNLLLWLVFLVRFKKLFSADDIMARFREGMESLLKDAERNTALNISVIDEKIKEAKAVSAEAERKVALLRRELQGAQSAAAFQAGLSARGQEREAASSGPAKKARAKPSSAKTARTASKAASSRAAKAYRQNELPGEDEAYALTGLFRENAQKSLFDAPQITVTQDGDAYGRVPVIRADMADAGAPIEVKKPFARRVRELSELGKTVEEIASATEHSTTEVQLVLDMI